MGERLNACQLEGVGVWQVDLHAEVGLWRGRMVWHDSLDIPGLASRCISVSAVLTAAQLRGGKHKTDELQRLKASLDDESLAKHVCCSLC